MGATANPALDDDDDGSDGKDDDSPLPLDLGGESPDCINGACRFV